MSRLSYTRAAFLGIALAVSGPAARAESVVELFTTSGCSCCLAWATHLRAAGLTVNVQDVAMGILARVKQSSGVPPQLGACHTAKVGGYVVEGHVPVREVTRLLAERPEALGIAVAGMPVGSPGMEAGTRREAFDVVLIHPDGSTQLYAHYPAAP